MTKRVVISRRKRETKATDFAFTQQMIPSQNGQGSTIVDEHRAQAWAAYQQFAVPHTRLEPWRRTDLRKLDVGSFQLPDAANTASLAPVPAELMAPLVGDRHGGQITLAPGRTDVELNPELAAKGVIFTDFATAAREHPKLLKKVLGQIVKPDEGKFAALTAAMARTGVFVYVPRNVAVDLPLHSVSWVPGVGLAHFSHIMVWVEEGASLTYVHESASPTETGGQTLNAGVVEIHVGANANVKFVELQSLGKHVWNFTHERVKVHRDGNMDWIFGAMGSHLTKNFSDLDLMENGAHGRMSGFYFTDGVQHLDHDTQQNHMAANTTSDLLFKGALRDNSHSVWQGMIYVAPGAQQTDGYQANRNLVLDTNARADSIPGLEIMADDVRCTHGATVGKIDENLVFYLLSRGISRAEAERLVVHGFFDPIMQRIPYEGVRERFAQAIQDKM